MTMRSERRRRFSTSTMRSVIAIAHSSPMRSGCDALVGAHEPSQDLGIEPAVGVRHERPRQSEDARIAGKVPIGQLRQLAVEPGGEMVADVPQLLVDDVEVVDQPLRGRRDRPFLADLLGEHAVRLEQHPSVVAHARRQGVALTRVGGDVLGGRQALGVLLEAFDAEQLRPDGLLCLRRRRQRGPFPVDEPENTSASHAPGTGADRRGGPVLVAMGLDIARRGSSRKPRRRRQV